MAPPTAAPATPPTSTDSASCPFTRVAQQGELVRKLKAEQAPKVPGHLSNHLSCPYLFVQSLLVPTSVCPIITLVPSHLSIHRYCTEWFVICRVLIRRPVNSRVQSHLSSRLPRVANDLSGHYSCPHIICMPVMFILNPPQQ